MDLSSLYANVKQQLFLVGQMLWFKQPPGQQQWGQKIIHEGMADGNFMGFIFDKKSYILIAGNQFNTLGLYWTMSEWFAADFLIIANIRGFLQLPKLFARHLSLQRR